MYTPSIKPDTGFGTTVGRAQLVAALTVDAHPRIATLCRCRDGVFGGSVSGSGGSGGGGCGAKTDSAAVVNSDTERGRSEGAPPLAIDFRKNSAVGGRSFPRRR